MPHRRSARLASWQIHLLIWSTLLLWFTGMVWLGLHYFGQTEGEFGPELSPLEPWMLRAHGLFMVFMLVGLGSLLVAHIPLGWRDRGQRPAAIALTSLFLFLIITGYALYYVGTVELRDLTSLLHWIAGIPVPLIFWWHYRRRYSAQHAKRS